MNSLANNTIHGVLVRMFNSIGVLITGEPGIGKSELALALIQRGHQLVADDLIELGLDNGTVIGACPKLGVGLLYIPDLEIINIAKLYGSQATLESNTIELVLNLQKGATIASGCYEKILNVPIPKVVIQNYPNRNPAVVETAVQNFLMNSRNPI